ncbi:formylglycine-generating enzyme family protein, partial [Thermodesulfobacteriota bacterium]
FMMGAPRREPGRRANERQRQVTLKQPFLIAEKLVTNGEYKKFEGSHSSGTFSGHSLDGQDQPVVDVTWNQAVAYLNWLSQQEDLEPFYQKQGDGYVTVSPPTNGYRLPTEAEWAFIARQAGDQEIQRYPWSGGFPPRSVVANLGDESARTILPRVIQGYNDTFPVTSPVGHFPANRAGLYDIGGNASEWCHDYYSAYTGRLTEDTDPLGPPVGTHRVIRGSNWRDATLAETRLSYRAYHKEARNNVGFRIARYP